MFASDKGHLCGNTIKAMSISYGAANSATEVTVIRYSRVTAALQLYCDSWPPCALAPELEPLNLRDARLMNVVWYRVRVVSGCHKRNLKLRRLVVKSTT